MSRNSAKEELPARVLMEEELKEPLENQAALVYNLLRKVIGIDFPIALSEE